MEEDSWTIEADDGELLVRPLPDGRRQLTAVPRDPSQFVHERTWSTAYPDDLIRFITATCGISGVCFEIMRDEDPAFIERLLVNDLSAYFDLGTFQPARILDFGCGSGASTAILARLFPDSEIVG